jgi:hypothetical protein
MTSTSIVRIDNPSRAQLDRCIARNQPAVFRGLMTGEVAARWDLPYLRTKLGAQIVQVASNDRPRLHWDPQAGLPIQGVPFSQFADAAFERPGLLYRYLQDDVNSIPALGDDYRLPSMIEEKGIQRAKFWLSAAGLVTPLHYDPADTLHWMIRGRKRFRLYRPGVRAYYPFSWKSTAPFISQVDPDRPEPRRYPRFARAEAQAIDFDLQEGELLYLPTFWWHQVTSLAPVNISLNFVWLASLAKCLRYFPQFARAARHLVKQIGKARAKAVQARRAARGPVTAHAGQR